MLAYPLAIGGWEVVILAFLVLLVFGGKKIPELMKGIGKGVRSFKEGLSETDDNPKEKQELPSSKDTDSKKE